MELLLTSNMKRRANSCPEACQRMTWHIQNVFYLLKVILPAGGAFFYSHGTSEQFNRDLLPRRSSHHASLISYFHSAIGNHQYLQYCYNHVGNNGEFESDESEVTE